MSLTPVDARRFDPQAEAHMRRRWRQIRECIERPSALPGGRIPLASLNHSHSIVPGGLLVTS